MRIPGGRQARRNIIISDPRPVANVSAVWASAGQAALIGIFLLAFIAFLYFSRPIMLPITAAAIVALTVGPLINAGNRHGISPWITALIIVLLVIAIVSTAATLLADR